MANKKVCILWDSSHIWGIMAWRALRSFGLDCRLVKSKEILQGGVLGKPAALLLVPGGNARLKAAALGGDGRAAIRQWLERGGIYFGFCGGAGLALSQGDPAASLAICPWRRADYPQRVLHFMSGHILARERGRGLINLPVWWPGRFAPGDDAGIEVLATYFRPGDDLWLADLPLARIPPAIGADWETRYGLCLDFPADNPLVIAGRIGRGQYMLSYAHLETPASQDANRMLCRLLLDFCGLETGGRTAPAWNTMPRPDVTQSGAELPRGADLTAAMALAHARLGSLMALGIELGLFFGRTPWLVGWHAGMPGMACNNLLAALAAMNELRPGASAQDFWKERQEAFLRLFQNFVSGAETFFWTWRMARTMGKDLGAELLARQREIFGHPMQGGGSACELLEIIEELIYLSQD